MNSAEPPEEKSRHFKPREELQYKTGGWSNDEIEFIKNHISTMSPEEMSDKLRRHPDTIRKFLSDKFYKALPSHMAERFRAEVTLKNSPEWEQLKDQFNESEQALFLYHWAQLVSQFKNDVTHTERLQIIDTVRIELLIARVMRKMGDVQKAVDELKSQLLDEEMASDGESSERSKMLQVKINDLLAAVGAYNKEYKDLMERKQQILRDIKGTREQRVKRIEESRETLSGWIAAVEMSPELKKELGEYIEKFRIATNVEYERLSEYHKYIDGTVEQPILNSETVKEDNII